MSSSRLSPKIVVARLGLEMEKITSPYQTTFAKGWYIPENLILAEEILLQMHYKTGDDGCMKIKLDMSNAYDQMDWAFLEKIQQWFGFHNRCVKLIHGFISTQPPPRGSFIPMSFNPGVRDPPTLVAH